MPKFFCDYCDVYLTHDSISVRKAHNSGRNHLRNVVDYYQQIGHEKAQSVIDSITSSYAAEGQPMPSVHSTTPGVSGPGGIGGVGGVGGVGGFPLLPPSAAAAAAAAAGLQMPLSLPPPPFGFPARPGMMVPPPPPPFGFPPPLGGVGGVGRGGAAGFPGFPGMEGAAGGGVQPQLLPGMVVPPGFAPPPGGMMVPPPGSGFPMPPPPGGFPAGAPPSGGPPGYGPPGAK